MPYLLMILETRGDRTARDESEARMLYDRMMAFTADLQDRGLLLAAEALKPDEHAVRLSIRGHQRKLLDGPFTEAKEMVGGFILIDVASRDEALSIAAACPAAYWATVEVRECAPCHER